MDCVISGLRRGVNEICAILDLPKRRMAISFRAWGQTIGPIFGCQTFDELLDPCRLDRFSRNVGKNYQYTLRKL